MAVLLLVLSLCTSLLSSGFTFYNSISNPYQTFLGPVGVYTWSGLAGEWRREHPALSWEARPRRLCVSESGTHRSPRGHRRAVETEET